MQSALLIKKLEQEEHLSEQEAFILMNSVMEGEISEERLEAMLITMNKRPIKAEELTGFVQALRTKSLNINAPKAVDNCGTGGSGITRINTSTIASFIVAAVGVKVAKHGNKAASGRCGSFDVLEAAEINIDLSPEQSQICFDETGLAFLYARKFHPAMKQVAAVRKKLGVPTVFNIIGPLLNPAEVKRQVIGISKPEIAPLILETLKKLGSEHVLIVHGDYNLDEIAVTGKSHIWELKDGDIKEYDIHPKDFGVETCKMAYIRGGDIEYNRRVMMSILQNKDREFRTEQVLFNAAAAIYVAGKADDIHQGYGLAKQALESKSALEKFHEYKELANSF